MARIKTTKSKNSKSYSIIDDYYRNGKRTTKIVDKIGNYDKVKELADKENIDVDTWCKCQYKNVQKRENSNVQKEEYYMFSFSSSKCSNLSLILYDNPFILTIVE